MRWKTRTRPKRRKSQIGDTRIVTKFAIFPVSNGSTTVWLEFYKIKQILRFGYVTHRTFWHTEEYYFK